MNGKAPQNEGKGARIAAKKLEISGCAPYFRLAIDGHEITDVISYSLNEGTNGTILSLTIAITDSLEAQL